MSRGAGRLKILYVVSIMPPHQGGAATDYASFVRGLADERFNRSVESVSVLTERGCAKGYGPRVEVKDRLLKYDTADEKRFLAQAVNYLIILGHILFGGHDIVHIHARYVYARRIGRIVWLALLLSRTKAVVDLRDRFYRGFGFGANFIVCSGALKEYYSWIKGAKCIPVPLALPAPVAWSEGENNIAYFGAISANKGVMELIEGFEQYRSSHGGFAELHLYGANAMGEDFISAIKDKKWVRYMGSVASGEVFEKIMEYRAVVLPSASEGMPRICLEAIYCEKPVVCHRNIRSIIPCIPGGFVLDNLTPEEFTRVFKNLEGREGPVRYGYDFSVHRPQSVCAALLKHYEDLRDATHAPRGEGATDLIKRRG